MMSGRGGFVNPTPEIGYDGFAFVEPYFNRAQGAQSGWTRRRSEKTNGDFYSHEVRLSDGNTYILQVGRTDTFFGRERFYLKLFDTRGQKIAQLFENPNKCELCSPSYDRTRASLFEEAFQDTFGLSLFMALR